MKRSPRTTSLEDTASPPQIDQRRLFLRQQPRTLVYVELEGGNGGIALNISEDGFCVQAVVALMEDTLPHVRFQLPGRSEWIETSAHIIWANESRKLVGARFVELPEGSRQVIREWLEAETQGPDVPTAADTRNVPETRKPRTPERLPSDRVAASQPAARQDSARAQAPFSSSRQAPFPEPPTLPTRPVRNSPVQPPPEASPAPPPAPPARQRPGAYNPGSAAANVSLPEPPIRTAPPSPPIREQQPVPTAPAPPAALSEALPHPAHQPSSAPNSGEPSFPSFSAISSTGRYRPPVEERTVGVSGVVVFFVFLGVVCIAAGWAMGAGDFSEAGFVQSIVGSGAKPKEAASAPNQPTQPSSGISEIEIVPSSGNSWKVPLAQTASAGTTSGNTVQQTPAPSANTGETVAPTSGSTNQADLAPPQNEQRSGASQQAAGPTVTNATHSPSVNVFPQYNSKPASSSEPELLYRVDPIYPADAIRQRVSGVVKLRLTVLRDGTVGQVFLVSGPPLLVDAAINAARRWRYIPATEDNLAKESSVDIGLVFQLP